MHRNAFFLKTEICFAIQYLDFEKQWPASRKMQNYFNLTFMRQLAYNKSIKIHNWCHVWAYKYLHSEERLYPEAFWSWKLVLECPAPTEIMLLIVFPLSQTCLSCSCLQDSALSTKISSTYSESAVIWKKKKKNAGSNFSSPSLQHLDMVMYGY